jgi:HSP20 family protein
MMAKDFIQLIRSSFEPPTNPEPSGIWRPAIDVYQTEAGWLLKADLAGVNPKDIGVEVHGRCIRIQGLRRDWCLEEGCRHYRLEIAYSRFERVIDLPEDLGAAKIDLDFRQGMLLIRIRKLSINE